MVFIFCLGGLSFAAGSLDSSSNETEARFLFSGNVRTVSLESRAWGSTISLGVTAPEHMAFDAAQQFVFYQGKIRRYDVAAGSSGDLVTGLGSVQDLFLSGHSVVAIEPTKVSLWDRFDGSPVGTENLAFDPSLYAWKESGRGVVLGMSGSHLVRISVGDRGVDVQTAVLELPAAAGVVFWPVAPGAAWLSDGRLVRWSDGSVLVDFGAPINAAASLSLDQHLVAEGKTLHFVDGEGNRLGGYLLPAVPTSILLGDDAAFIVSDTSNFRPSIRFVDYDAMPLAELFGAASPVTDPNFSVNQVFETSENEVLVVSQAKQTLAVWSPDIGMYRRVLTYPGREFAFRKSDDRMGCADSRTGKIWLSNLDSGEWTEGADLAGDARYLTFTNNRLIVEYDGSFSTAAFDSSDGTFVRNIFITGTQSALGFGSDLIIPKAGFFRYNSSGQSVGRLDVIGQQQSTQLSVGPHGLVAGNGGFVAKMSSTPRLITTFDTVGGRVGWLNGDLVVLEPNDSDSRVEIISCVRSENRNGILLPGAPAGVFGGSGRLTTVTRPASGRLLYQSFDEELNRLSTSSGPAAPASPPSVDAFRHDRLLLTWMKAQPEADAIRVEYRLQSTFERPWLPGPLFDPSDSSVWLTGLLANREYQVRLSAIRGGFVSNSYLISATTLKSAQALSGEPFELQVGRVMEDLVELNWRDNDEREAGFIIHRFRQSDEVLEESIRVPAGTTTHNATGLAGSTSYRFSVQMVDDSDEGPESAQVMIATPAVGSLPIRQTILEDVEARLGQVEVTWKMPLMSNHEGFAIFRQVNGIEAVEIARVGPYETSFVDLDPVVGPGSSYFVRAFNDYGLFNGSAYQTWIQVFHPESIDGVAPVVHDHIIYLLERDGNLIHRFDTEGGEWMDPVRFCHFEQAHHLAVSNEGILVATFEDVFRIPVSGGEPVLVHSESAEILDLQTRGAETLVFSQAGIVRMTGDVRGNSRIRMSYGLRKPRVSQDGSRVIGLQKNPFVSTGNILRFRYRSFGSGTFGSSELGFGDSEAYRLFMSRDGRLLFDSRGQVRSTDDGSLLHVSHHRPIDAAQLESGCWVLLEEGGLVLLSPWFGEIARMPLEHSGSSIRCVGDSLWLYESAGGPFGRLSRIATESLGIDSPEPQAMARIGIPDQGLWSNAAGDLFSRQDGLGRILRIPHEVGAEAESIPLPSSPRLLFHDPEEDMVVACFGDSEVMRIPLSASPSFQVFDTGAVPSALAHFDGVTYTREGNLTRAYDASGQVIESPVLELPSYHLASVRVPVNGSVWALRDLSPQKLERVDQYQLPGGPTLAKFAEPVLRPSPDGTRVVANDYLVGVPDLEGSVYLGSDIRDGVWLGQNLVTLSRTGFLELRDAAGVRLATRRSTSGGKLASMPSSEFAASQFSGGLWSMEFYSEALDLLGAYGGREASIFSLTPSVRALSGLPLELEVVTSGRPPAGIRWSKDGAPVFYGPKFVVPAATPSDSGEYVVELLDDRGRVTDQASTVVQVFAGRYPRFLEGHVLVKVGDKLRHLDSDGNLVEEIDLPTDVRERGDNVWKLFDLTVDGFGDLYTIVGRSEPYDPENPTDVDYQVRIDRFAADTGVWEVFESRTYPSRPPHMNLVGGMGTLEGSWFTINTATREWTGRPSGTLMLGPKGSVVRSVRNASFKYDVAFHSLRDGRIMRSFTSRIFDGASLFPSLDRYYFFQIGTLVEDEPSDFFNSGVRWDLGLGGTDERRRIDLFEDNTMLAIKGNDLVRIDPEREYEMTVFASLDAAPITFAMVRSMEEPDFTGQHPGSRLLEDFDGDGVPAWMEVFIGGSEVEKDVPIKISVEDGGMVLDYRFINTGKVWIEFSEDLLSWTNVLPEGSEFMGGGYLGGEVFRSILKVPFRPGRKTYARLRISDDVVPTVLRE